MVERNASNRQTAGKKKIDARVAVGIGAAAAILIGVACYLIFLMSTRPTEDKSMIFHRPTMQGPPPGVQR